MRVSDKLARAGVALKDTTHPGNIGAAARDMRWRSIAVPRDPACAVCHAR